jgi:4-hydroxy-tetrahydrodipicolinate synthase
MATKGRMFAGCTVALPTPFRDGAVHLDALRRSVDRLIASGVQAVSPAGTTGESPTLSPAEHQEVVAAVVEHSAGRAKVLAGSGSSCTAQAIHLTRFAQLTRADGALLVSPYYNRPNQEGLYAHYARIAESVDLPLVLYNVPSRTGRNLEPATVERLAKIGNFVAIKEAAGSLDQASELVARTNLTVLSGDDSLTLPMLAVGAKGVVSVAANIVPDDVMRMIAAFERGDNHEARRIHGRLFPLFRAMLDLGPNPVPLKAALRFLRLSSDEVRLPLLPLEPHAKDSLCDLLAALGLPGEM